MVGIIEHKGTEMIQTIGEYIEQDANFFYFRTYNSYCSSNSSFWRINCSNYCDYN